MLGSLRNSLLKRFSSFVPPPLLSSTSSSSSLLQTTQQLQLKRPSHGQLSTHLSHVSTSASSTLTDTSTPPYLSVRIWCSKHVSDMLSEALLCFGASSASIDEPGSYESIDEICISSIYTDGQDVGTSISHAAESIGLKEMPSYEVIMCEQYDWIKNAEESFHPVKVTDDLWIIPEWRTPIDVQAANVILNPGLAFGSGEHPTTKLCLLLLHGLIKGGERVLDYGTGSGILGISAVKLGAAISVGIDVDPQAITISRQNSVLNNIAPEKFELYLAPHEVTHLAEMETFDIVIANILLNPLIELADRIVTYAKPGAVIGVSGILSEQLPQIEGRYSQYLDSISVSEMDGWICVSGTKKWRKQ